MQNSGRECSRTKNRGYLGLSEKSLKVGFGYPFKFYTFIVQNIFTMGFKIFRLSIIPYDIF